MQIVADKMEGLGMQMPEPTVDLTVVRSEYHAATAAENEGKKKGNKKRTARKH